MELLVVAVVLAVVEPVADLQEFSGFLVALYYQELLFPGVAAVLVVLEELAL